VWLAKSIDPSVFTVAKNRITVDEKPEFTSILTGVAVRTPHSIEEISLGRQGRGDIAVWEAVGRPGARARRVASRQLTR
jgi:hypothetical protein